MISKASFSDTNVADPRQLSGAALADALRDSGRRTLALVDDLSAAQWSPPQQMAPGMCAAIVGTAKADHLNHRLEWTANGALDAAWVTELQDAFARHDRGWGGQI